MQFVFHKPFTSGFKRFAYPGVSALTMIIGISLILVVLSLGMGLISYFESATLFSHTKAQQAYLVAQSGVYDALYRISLNKGYENLTGYTLTVANGSTNVVVDKDNPQTGFTLVTSTAIVGNTRRVLEAKLTVDSVSGKVTILSWQEKTI